MIILKISNLSKHQLDTFNIFEKNYLTWVASKKKLFDFSCECWNVFNSRRER